MIILLMKSGIDKLLFGGYYMIKLCHEFFFILLVLSKLGKVTSIL